ESASILFEVEIAWGTSLGRERSGKPFGTRLLPDEEDGAARSPFPSKHGIPEQRVEIEVEVVDHEALRGSGAVRIDRVAAGFIVAYGILAESAEVEGSRGLELYRRAVAPAGDERLRVYLEGQGRAEGHVQPRVDREGGLVERG